VLYGAWKKLFDCCLVSFVPGFLAEQLEEDGSLESFSQLQRSRPKLQKVQLLDPFFFWQLHGWQHLHDVASCFGQTDLVFGSGLAAWAAGAFGIVDPPCCQNFRALWLPHGHGPFRRGATSDQST